MMEVKTHGPWFDGRAPKAVQEACKAIDKSIATIGASMVRTELDNVLQVQTPHYRLMIEAADSSDSWKIWDQDVVYGPWLEGIGSRNAPVTRFAGYHTFERMGEEIRRRAPDIANAVMRPFVEMME